MREYLRNFNLNPPLTSKDIAIFEADSGIRLPGDYVDFLRIGNGGEGFIGDSYALFWRLDELKTLNAEYEVDEFAPGLLLIGSDGGGEAFGFDTRERSWPVVRVPFVGMDIDLLAVLGRTFPDFLKALCEAH